MVERSPRVSRLRVPICSDRRRQHPAERPADLRDSHR
jgi:hypothetical protein